MESIKFDKSRNKIVRKSCRKLKEQGANVTEVYINLFNNLITSGRDAILFSLIIISLYNKIESNLLLTNYR